MTIRFVKILSANDVGATGAHMAGIAIPKGNHGLIGFLPKLDPSKLNPSEEIDCETDSGEVLRLRYVYYNNKMHVPKGTRNEYRITHLTAFLRNCGAKEGDSFEISRASPKGLYRIRVIPKGQASQQVVDDGPVRIRLSGAWRRIH
jgi:hypothetical protein